MGLDDDVLHQRLINQSEATPNKSVLSQPSDSSSQPFIDYNDTPGFMAQSKLLIYKNVILTFRNPKNLIFLAITPFLLSLFLFVFQGLARDNGQRTILDT
jgi:hypothetical protein